VILIVAGRSATKGTASSAGDLVGRRMRACSKSQAAGKIATASCRRMVDTITHAICLRRRQFLNSSSVLFEWPIHLSFATIFKGKQLQSVQEGIVP